MRAAQATVLALASVCLVRAASLDDLPLNRWVRLEVAGEAGYTYSQPIWVPSRGQVLHWGAVERNDPRPWHRNDVRAFDVKRMDWVSDYPRAAKLPGLQTPPYGKGVFWTGFGEMLPCGTPAPSMIANGVCHDSKRDQVVYTMNGLMAAYDPKARKWRDLKARTVIGDREFPGGPAVYGIGTCYDPVNDEILLFPHWGASNDDLRDVTGRMSGHLGTLVYRFTDNTWRRIGEGLGSDMAREARAGAIECLREESTKLDSGFAQRAPVDQNALCRLWHFEGELEGELRVEPPPRCGTPMVYDPEHKAIVMFGGHSGLVRTDLGETGHLGGPPGALNDTWLYDVTTKQWRELKLERRPPPTLWPKLVRDPASGLLLLVTRSSPWAKEKERAIVLWALDLGKREWAKLHEQPWSRLFSDAHATGWRPDPFEIALDEKHGLLLLTQNISRDRRPVQDVYAFRLDAGRLGPTPAPRWEDPPPVKPIAIPPDDPAWVAKLKTLPPNTWVKANPPRNTAARDWGNAACDPVRGWVVYWGGGHSTYQVNNPDIYAVGANRWVTTAGDHNDWVPPVAWGGCAMGLRGGPHAHHMRNEYVALDGRVFRSIGTDSRRTHTARARVPGPRFAWFFDVDRGGVWRQTRIATVKRGDGVLGTYGRPCVVHPDGKVIGFGGTLEPYDGRFFTDEPYVNVYDIYANTLAVKAVPPPHPGITMECRPFCTLPDRNQVFFYECVVDEQGVPQRQATWVYGIKANRFTDLKARRHPPGPPGTVVYLEGQKAVLAAARNKRDPRGGIVMETWVYSLERNTWAPFPTQGEQVRYAWPYTQMVYVAKHGVVVNLPKTELLRPDVSKVTWD